MSDELVKNPVEIAADAIQYRTWDNYDLVEDAAINKFALDVEAERQAELMVKWLSVLNQAHAILNKKQEELEYAEAELRIEVKKNGIDGIQKVTDATAESWVIMHPRRKAALEAKNKAYTNYQYLLNAKTVMDHRRDMIKTLDHLYVAGYYARPKVSDEASKITESEIKSATRTKLKASLTRRAFDNESTQGE